MIPGDLEAALGSGPFRFRMGLTRLAELRGWLDSHRGGPREAAERARILREHPERFAVAAGADPGALSAALDALDVLLDTRTLGRADERLEAFATAFAVDAMLVTRVGLTLSVVAVAFPSGWAPERLLGRSTGEIHGVVPGLEPALGTSIERFLMELPAGRAYARTNVGVAVSAALDRHPDAGAPSATEHTPVDRLGLRIEDQAFVGLDEATLLFLVGLRQVPLGPLLDDPATATMLREWLATMPDAVARYKGILPVRERLLASASATLAPPR